MRHAAGGMRFVVCGAVPGQVSGLEPFEWSAVPWGVLTGHAVAALIFNFTVNFGVAVTCVLRGKWDTQFAFEVPAPLNCASWSVSQLFSRSVGR